MKNLFLLVLVSLLVLPAYSKDTQGKYFYITVKDGKKTKVYYADSGPGDIDVSKYPAIYQKNYPFVKKKCEKCHVFNRAVNTSKEGDGWALYVEYMTKKRKSGIRKKDKQKIIEWLNYDNKVRPRVTPTKSMK